MRALVRFRWSQLFANETSGKHWGSARVRIVLINENDNRPIFSLPLYNVSVWENATMGTSVVQVLVSGTCQALGPTGEGLNRFFYIRRHRQSCSIHCWRIDGGVPKL